MVKLLRSVKKKLPLPVIWGGISTFASSLLVLYLFLVTSEPDREKIFPAPAAAFSVQDNPSPEIAAEEEIVHEKDTVNFLAETKEKKQDRIQEMYRNPDTREYVIDFFQGICGSREIAEIILANADTFDIEPALAFALAWEESRFNPLAVNRQNRNKSVDLGLFQLNNRAFPNIAVQSFFDPNVNARYGMGHLREFLNSGGSEISALAMYNAGPGRVKDTGAPKITLDYIHRIMENQRKIESHFEDWFRIRGF